MEGMFYGAYNRQGRQMTVASWSCNWFMMRRTGRKMIMFIVMRNYLYVLYPSHFICLSISVMSHMALCHTALL